ncbi:jouberin-like [Asbolus verrucosus]|uniref:Jouberin-like n=1 Tax=Asbolus verrucosus TaxID=1661398 RepID=A0A482W4C6_ASBVE|nr:jouberin-like [Asbolus verrucosus]
MDPYFIRSETKDKFEALMRVATHKSKKQKNGKSKSKEKLMDDLQSSAASNENLLNNDNLELNNIINDQSKNYILNKFLDQTNDRQMNEEIISVKMQNDDLISIKPPVPKPRKNKCNALSENIQSPTTSQGTFNVTSPKITKNTNNDSPSSNKTYNVEEIGDLLIHESPLHPKIMIKTEETTSKFIEKGDTETLSDASRPKSEKDTTHRNFLKTDEGKTSELNTDLIEYENRLQMNSLVIHPVVKINVVDLATGSYFPKSDKNRSVVFFYETKDYSYISPVMTHTYNLQEKRVLFPSWEETILLNEDYEYFKNESHRIILFFEVLDFVSLSAKHQLNQKDCIKGWHNIAFAFLKLSNKNNAFNAGQKMRLQLYYTQQIKKDDPHMCNTWIWWKKKKLEKYPSTLYVTLKSVMSPTKCIETFRSKTPVQGETSSKHKLFDEDVKKEVISMEKTMLINQTNKDPKTTPTWSRSSHEICKLPNKCLIKFDNNLEDGCFVMKFSFNGHFLACSVRNNNLFYIILFSVLSLKEVNRFPSHQGLIYDMKWSADDSLLISASADNTISVFNILTSSFFQSLPHPSFVYCCGISEEKVIVSGCFDETIRIWSRKQTNENSEFHLFQELKSHKGYITSVCFTKKSNILSADSVGVIIEWKKETDDWTLKRCSFLREILLLDLKETIINQIMLIPKEKKLLVHSRDNTLRLIDLKSGCVLQWLRECKHSVLFHRVEHMSTLEVKMAMYTCGIPKMDMK